MSHAQKLTLAGLFLVAGAVAIWDVVLYADDVPGNTISSVLNPMAWAAALAGYGCGHLFTPRRTTLTGEPSNFANIGVVAALTTAAGAMLHPLIALLLGISSGAIFWPNSRKT